MANMHHCEFFVLRYVPDLVKNEFVNFGVVMLENGAETKSGSFADVRFTSDWRRVQCVDSNVDIEMLAALEDDLRRRLAQAGDRESLLNEMESSFSGTLQISETKVCQTDSPRQEIERLAEMY